MVQFIHIHWLRIFLILLGILFLGLLVINNLLADVFLEYLFLYKYIALFCVVFLGGLFIPLPVNVFLIAVGALSAGHEFGLKLAIVVATTGNFLGDLVAYSLFKKYGHSILRDQYVAKYPFFLRLEQFFKSYAAISIFISRIIGLFGTPVNFLSGYTKTPLSTYALFDFLGNLTYAAIFLTLGFWVGEEWVKVSDFMNLFMNVVGVGMFIAIILMLYRTRKQTNLQL